MSELKHMHAKTECLPFNTEDVRLIITERYGKQEIRMHGEDARFIVEAIAAAKRRTQPEATKPAQDLSAAILALPLPNTTLTAEVAGYKVPVYGAQHMRDFAMAAAALASPADALVAGDRVDTLQEIATKLRRAGADIPAPQHDDAIKGATINGLSIALLLVDEAIQAQKDGHK